MNQKNKVEGGEREKATEEEEKGENESQEEEEIPVVRQYRYHNLPIAPVLTSMVHFHLEAGGLISKIYAIDSEVREMIKMLEDEFDYTPGIVQMWYNNNILPENLPLAGFYGGSTSTVDVRSLDPQGFPIISQVNVVFVKLDKGDVRIEVEKPKIKKLYLGGFRNRSTGMEYHHASMQTLPFPKQIKEAYHRDTQTANTKTRTQQTCLDNSTQMTRHDYWVSVENDVVITPKRYVTADEIRKNYIKKVVQVQKICRGFLARKELARRMDLIRKTIAWLENDIRKGMAVKENYTQRELERKVNPQTKLDFDLLFRTLREWKEKEIKEINVTKDGPERKIALRMLLIREAEIIAVIEKYKKKARARQAEQDMMKFFEKTSSPKTWWRTDGQLVSMDTRNTQRARELKELHDSLLEKKKTAEERLDVLVLLKKMIQPFDCGIVDEITELIEREADLLAREIDPKNLSGLRLRLLTLYRQLCRDPTFNPEAIWFLEYPIDLAPLKNDLYMCKMCKKCLPSSFFQVSIAAKAVKRCIGCERLDNDARKRCEFGWYRHLLRKLRRDEEQKGAYTSIAFIMQASDLKFLVETIWNGQSALSGMDDLHDLCLARWETHVEWSPWNCVLLTLDEAKAHSKLENLQAYEPTFRQRVLHKQEAARSHFSSIPHLAGRVAQFPITPPPGVRREAATLKFPMYVSAGPQIITPCMQGPAYRCGPECVEMWERYKRVRKPRCLMEVNVHRDGCHFSHECDL